MAAVILRQWRWRPAWKLGGSLVSAQHHQRQHCSGMCSGSAAGAVSTMAAAACGQHSSGGSGGSNGISGSSAAVAAETAGSALAAQHRHGHSNCRRRCAATPRRCSGNEDTGSDSNSRGTDNNQQSTKSSQQWQVRVGSTTLVGMAEATAATAVLPPCTATLAMKTPAVTAIAGAQTLINN